MNFDSVRIKFPLILFFIFRHKLGNILLCDFVVDQLLNYGLDEKNIMVVTSLM
jgi:hypothetical protein